MMSITIVRNLPEHVWRKFVDENPSGNIFHTPDMYQVFKQARGHRPQLWAALNHENILALMVPVLLSATSDVYFPLTTRSVLYGGVLCLPTSEGRNAQSELLHSYRSSEGRKVLFTESRNLYNTATIQPHFQKNEFIYDDHLNYLINLDLPEEQIWKNITPSAQRNIKKALKKQKLEIVEIQNSSQIDEIYAILQKTYTNAKVPLAHPSLFRTAFNLLAPKGMVKFFVGRIDGMNVATSVVLLYKDIIYGWYRGFDREYSCYLPNDLMVWELLKWGSKAGYRLFDFGGAGRPDEVYGPRNFKAKFGGVEVNYGRNFQTNYPFLLKMSKLAYKVIRQFSSFGRKK
jgi:hypothetical protein